MMRTLAVSDASCTAIEAMARVGRDEVGGKGQGEEREGHGEREGRGCMATGGRSSIDGQ